MAVYRAVVIPALTYGSESWVPYARHIKALERLQRQHLRQLMRIRWYHKVSNAEVLRRADCTSIEILISRARLRWCGHVLRMADNRLPKCTLYSELLEGRRNQGGQRKRYKDVLHCTLKEVKAQTNWEESALDRTKWRAVVSGYGGPSTKRPPRQPINEDHPCLECGRVCRSRIGLHSHLRSHARGRVNH